LELAGGPVRSAAAAAWHGLLDARSISSVLIISLFCFLLDKLTEGWHLPALDHNPDAQLVAIVDPSPHPQSNLNPNLESLEALQQKYQTQIYASTQAMLQDTCIASQLDGVVIATPHATHYDVCREIMSERDRRRSSSSSSKNNTDAQPLHILMEKPMSTDIQHALELYQMIRNNPDSTTTTGGGVDSSQFWINHSANYRTPTKLARDIVSSGQLGRLRHVTAYFASPLKWIFDEPACRGWNEPASGMLGNGFAWGQSSHLWAFLYHVCPQLQPYDVYCALTHSTMTGADVSFGATVRCRVIGNDDDDDAKDNDTKDNDTKNNDYAVLSVSGTSLLPGHAHSDPPVPKQIQIAIFGDEASLHYSGNDRDPTSGCLELRRPDGTVQVVYDQFQFENCYEGASVLDGLKSIQTIDAMYRSHASSRVEKVIGLDHSV
jgi:predicted dehydrogenase